MQDIDELTTAREAAIVREVVGKLPLPPNVRGYDIEFGEDSTGYPSVWISLTIEDELNPSPQVISALSRFVDEVTDELVRRRLRHWPYIRYRPAA